MLLTQEERDKFATYLAMEADSSEGMASQMEKTNLPSVVIKKYKTEAMACRIVAQMLRSTHDERIGG